MGFRFSTALMRVCFPSWRFFDDLHWVPVLEIRLIDDGAEFSWIRAFPTVHRSLFSLFLNPRSNLRLAGQSLVEWFMEEIEELPEGAGPSEARSYPLLVRVARFQTLDALGGRKGSRFQFRILSVVPGSEMSGEHEELVLSGVHEI